eukprot:TRINITY_DN3963_c0_g1_i1.p1 TRINITY_DN3963_c0_g1~~TRINITY_DN3963_c0_g1_i1.p1  ORF type:complete len:483 (+),score=105.50 TRINITY_DN3963_c0_g1_i1:8-1456(+)
MVVGNALTSGDHVRVIASFLELRELPFFIVVCRHWRLAVIEADKVWTERVLEKSILPFSFLSAWKQYASLKEEHKDGIGLALERHLRHVGASPGASYYANESSAYNYVCKRFNHRQRMSTMTEQNRQIFKGHQATIWTFEADELEERFVITGGGDSAICVFRLQGDEKDEAADAVAIGRPWRRLAGHTNEVFGLKLALDQKRLLSASRDHSVRVWDFEIGAAVKCFAEHTGWVFSADFFPDSNNSLIVSASFDRLVKLWDTREAGDNSVHSFEGHTNAVNSVSISWFNDRQFWSSGNDGRLILWDARSPGRVIEQSNNAGIFNHIALSNPAEEEILACSQQGPVNIWNRSQMSRSLTGHSDWVKTARAIGEVIVTGSNDCTARVWKSDGQCVSVLEGVHTDVIECVDFNDSAVITGGMDRSIGVWFPERLNNCDSRLVGSKFTCFNQLRNVHDSSIIKVKLLTGNRILSCGGDPVLKLTTFN